MVSCLSLQISVKIIRYSQLMFLPDCGAIAKNPSALMNLTPDLHLSTGFKLALTP